MAKKIGRPTRYTTAMGKRICDEIREGKTMRQICEPQGMPHKSQVYRWLSMPSLKTFRDQFSLAQDQRVETWAEEIVDIADEGINDTYVDDQGNVRTDNDVIQRSKLRVSTRQWLMAKRAPKKYGDKLDLTSDGKEIKTVTVFNMRPGDIAATAKKKE